MPLRRPRPLRFLLLRVLLLLLTAVAIAGAALVLPRRPAVDTLLAFGAPKPEDGALPAGVTLLEGEDALGFERVLRGDVASDGTRPTVVLVHGITERGVVDGRLIQAVDMFRAAGCVVLAPEVPSLVDPAARHDDLHLLVGLFERLQRGEVPGCRPAAFSLIGVSVGGSVALKALATFRRDGGRGCRGALLIGAPFAMRRVASAWFDAAPFAPVKEAGGQDKRLEAASFGRALLWRTAAARLLAHEDDVAAIRTWLQDAWEPSGLPDLASGEARAFAEAIVAGPAAWQAGREGMLAASEDVVARLAPAAWPDLLAHLGGVPIFLLHGRADPLIPVTEAKDLAAALGPVTPVVVLRSELVGHEEIKPTHVLEHARHIVFLDDFYDMVGP